MWPIHSYPALFSSSESEDDKEGSTTPAIVTPDNNCATRFDFSPVQWDQARSVLKDNPLLMTSNVLISALQQQPHKDIVAFMLSVNPKSANIPKEGPTPLQFAVQHGCSCEIVLLLLKAWPFALCRTNPGYEEDPLASAKHRFRANKELIQLLQKPLGHWMEAREPKSRPEKPQNVVPLQNAEDMVEFRETSVDRQEFSNVKLLCAQLLKGHKKLNQRLTICQEQLQAAEYKKSEIMKEIDQQRRTQFRHELIAWDMKEKAMRWYCKAMEERCTKYCESKVNDSESEMKAWKSTVDDRMKEWELLLEQEAKVNEYIRNDIFDWVEDQERAQNLSSIQIMLEKEEDLLHAKKRTVCRPWNRLNSD
jgi:hypothetical protein